MARSERLIPFQDLDLIGGYAEKFAMDPDVVYWQTSFHTLMNFVVMWKEKEEYRERFSYIWKEISRDVQ